MDRIQELIKAMETIVAHAEKEDRAMTDAEQKELDELQAEFDQLVADAETGAAERQAAHDERVAALQAARERAAAAAAIPAAPAAGPSIVRPQGPEAAREFESLADFMASAAGRPNDPRLSGLWSDGVGAVDQSMGSGQHGGFLVPTQFLNQIYEVEAEQTIVRSRATVIPAGSSPDAAIDMPALDQTGTNPANVYGGLEFSWIGEGDAKPNTNANFRSVRLTPHELAGHVVVTDKLMRNAPALGAYLARKMPAALLSAEDTAFITGNGIAKPTGFINSDAAYSQTRETTSSVTYADLVQMDSRILGETGYVWIIAKGAKPTIKQIQDNSGGSPGVGAYIFAEGDLTRGIPDTILGRPVIWSERVPALGSKGDVSLVNLSEYYIKDGFGPFIAASEHVAFINNKTTVKIFTNVDGKPALTAPIKGLDNRSYSPFVVLAA